MENKITNKQYVGYTKQSVKSYMVQRKYDATRKDLLSTRYLYKSIRKHGWDNFTWRIITIVETLNEAKSTEIFFIKEYKTKWPNGYNMTDTGVRTSAPKHMHLDENDRDPRVISKIRISIVNTYTKEIPKPII